MNKPGPKNYNTASFSKGFLLQFTPISLFIRTGIIMFGKLVFEKKQFTLPSGLLLSVVWKS
jgi:hypothetical protein